MANQSVVGIYASMENVERAINALSQGGFPIKQVSVTAQNIENEKKVHGFVTAGDIAKTGAASRRASRQLSPGSCSQRL